jgi:sulfate transport system permease protein
VAITFKKRGVLPGFSLTLGFSVLYLSLIVLIPLSATFFKAATLGWGGFWEVISHPRVLASYKLTFGAALAGAAIGWPPTVSRSLTPPWASWWR